MRRVTLSLQISVEVPRPLSLTPTLCCLLRRLSYLCHSHVCLYIFLSSCAFFTIANLEWGEPAASPLYGGSFVPCITRDHSLITPLRGWAELKRAWKEEGINPELASSSLDTLPYLHTLTSRIQSPCGYSPHVCVVMNGHFVKPIFGEEEKCLKIFN